MKVFLTSPWIPPEWIKAHRLEPRGIWGQPAPRDAAPAAGVCAYAEWVRHWAAQERHAAFVLTTHCDQLRRVFDLLSLGVPGSFFLFNLPATHGTTASGVLFQDELMRLSRWLLNLGGSPPELESLTQLMRDYERARQRLRACLEGWGRHLVCLPRATPNPPNASSPRPLPAGSLLHLSQPAQGEAVDYYPARKLAEALLRFHVGGHLDLPTPCTTPISNHHAGRTRLALVGGPFTAQYWPLLDEIEQAGSSVVLDATEAGERGLGERMPGTDEPQFSNLNLEQLASLFLNRIVDMFQRPNNRLYAWLKPRLIERQVQGLVLWQYFGCDLWRAEQSTLRETFRLPVLMLEADETGSGLERAKIRLHAFLESLHSA